MLGNLKNFIYGIKYLVVGPERDYARNELREFVRDYWDTPTYESPKSI
jgi:hypothetical protein